MDGGYIKDEVIENIGDYSELECINILTEWADENNYNKDCLFLKTLQDGGLTFQNMVIVVDTVDCICPGCYNDHILTCHCQNDE